jgi:hypothetical protein
MNWVLFALTMLALILIGAGTQYDLEWLRLSIVFFLFGVVCFLLRRQSKDEHW